MRGDITGQVGFDAVVNAANAELAHGGGVAGAIHPCTAATSPPSSECIGVVLRGGIERGCVAMKHDPGSCTVVSHLKRDVTFVAEGVTSVGSRKRPAVFLDSAGLPVDISLGD